MIYRQLLSVMENLIWFQLKVSGSSIHLHEAVAVEEISDTELDGKIVKEIHEDMS